MLLQMLRKMYLRLCDVWKEEGEQEVRTILKVAVTGKDKNIA